MNLKIMSLNLLPIHAAATYNQATMSSLHGIAPRGQVDDGPIDTFIRKLSSLSAEEWQRRIEALKTLVNSTPDYSTTCDDDGSHVDPSLTPCSQPQRRSNNNTSAANQSNATIIPWYRSSKSVRRLAAPLKTLLLDARSAVVKEAAELIGVLLSVKLQCHPSFLTVEEDDNINDDNSDTKNDSDKEIDDIFNNATTTPNKQSNKQAPPPPPFVGRLLFKDLLPSILQLSGQTVKVIRTYGVNMTLTIIPHCRVKSALVILLERMKSDKNRNVREDCARYLRCVLETWPIETDNKINSRAEEQLSYDAAQQIGMGLGRALTDPAQPVRTETKRGFQIIFQRFRPVWNDVMKSGIIRDVRLRKNLLEAASRSESENGGLFDDMASLGDLSLNTERSFTSMRSNTSYRSYASRGIGIGGRGGNTIPSVIGTPNNKVDRKYGRYSPSTTTPSSGTKIRNKESSSTYSTSSYVLSSGHVVSSSTPQRTSRLPPPSSLSPRKSPRTPTTPKQPFASLMQTPQPNKNETTPTRNHNNNNNNHHHNTDAIRQSPKPAKVLRKRLSRRISGIDGLEAAAAINSTAHMEYTRQLSSIAEKNDDGISATGPSSPSTANGNANNNNSEEITFVALEVISAHLAHLDKVEKHLSREKDLLLDLNNKLGISVSDSTNSDELARCLSNLTEEQVCDYFESVHVCVDAQRNASESLLREMERISQGGGGDISMSSSDAIDTSNSEHGNGVMDGLSQSPLHSKSNGLERVQRDLGAQF